MKTAGKHDCTDELHDAKLRVTPARLGVLAMLEQADIPVDVSMVVKYLRKQNISANEATVFRILNAFTKKGIIKPINFSEGKQRYEYAGKPSHHHFICNRCGEITDVTGCIVDDWQKSIEQQKGVSVERHSLEFFGLCADCKYII